MKPTGWTMAVVVTWMTAAAGADDTQVNPETPGDPESTGRWYWLPEDEIFRQPTADTHEPRSYATLLHMDTKEGNFDLGSVGFGDSFPVARWEASDGLAFQFGISAAAFSLFNFDGVDNDLVNTDFVVGAPLSVRKGAWSGRFRFFHQSSHVETPFLFRFAPRKLSYEAVELLGAVDVADWNFYAGPTVILSSTTGLQRLAFQGGAEIRRPLGEHCRWFGALDLNSKEANDWHPDLDLRVGMEVHQDNWDRAVGFYLELFHGHIPYGAYDRFRASWAAFGVMLRF